MPPTLPERARRLLRADTASGGVARLLVASALLLAFLAGVHRHLADGADVAQPGVDTGAASGRKLFVLLVDGMRPEDAADPRLTFLAPLRAGGFHVEMDPCLEGITLPCVNEAFSGAATSGLMGAWENLVSAGESRSSSLFTDLARTGRTSGVAHRGELVAFSGAITREYRGKEPKKALAEMFAAGLHLVVWHDSTLDEAAHHHKVGSEAYGEALDRLDADAREVLAGLPPAYDWVVFGDHGHTTSGRHLYGLDVPTAFYGPADLFVPGSPEGRVPLASVRYLLGSVYGVLPPDRYEGADLAAWLPADSAIRAAAEKRVYKPHVAVTGMPGLALVASVGLLVAGLAAGPGGALATAGLLLAWKLGGAYLALLPTIHSAKFPYVMERVAACVLTAGAVGWGWKRDGRGLVAGLAIAALALPGTLYTYGFFRNVPDLLLIGGLGLALPGRLREARASGRWGPVLVAVGATLLGWWLLSSVSVRHFRIFTFPRLHDLPDWTCALAWAGVAAAFVEGRARKAAAVLVALAGPTTWGRPEGMGLAALTMAAPVVAGGAPGWLPVLAAWAAVPWYGVIDATGIAACLLFASGLARLAGDDARLRAAWLPAVALGVGYLSLAHAAGLRTSGLDFDFAIRWLPEDRHQELWYVVAAALVVKVLVPPGLVALAVRRAAGAVDPEGRAGGYVLLRLAAGALFVTALLASGDPPRSRLFELLEDLVAWPFVLVAVLLVTRPGSSPLPAAAAGSR